MPHDDPRGNGLPLIYSDSGDVGSPKRGTAPSPTRIDRCPREAEGDVADRSDIGLVVAITRGVGDALGEVYRRHGGHVLGLARRLCGESRAEEVVQEVFLELWRKPERFEGDRGSLRTFLMTQTYGRSVDRLRTDGARRERESAHGTRRPARHADLEADVLERLDSEAVWQHLLALPGNQRDAIVLAFVAGHTYRDVARLLGQPEGTVKSRIRCGLSGLRAQLCDEGWRNEDSRVGERSLNA